jgi:uncharacterized protein YdaU (DUF1376 family)
LGVATQPKRIPTFSLPQFLLSGFCKWKKMHYYQFNIGDYQSHTSHLSEMEDLAFRRMLDWCYLHEKPLPSEVDEIARVIRMRSHSDSIAVVLREFFTQHEQGWVSERVLEEIEKVGEKSKKASASAKARWEKKDANALPTQSESNATQDTRHITQDTIKNATKVATPKGVSDSVWQEFKALRQKKRATVTQRVVDSLQAEADKAGITLEKALHECCVRGWQAFKAEWVAPKANPADIVRLTVPSNNLPDPALEKIKADEKRAAPIPLEVLAKMAALRAKA